MTRSKHPEVKMWIASEVDEEFAIGDVYVDGKHILSVVRGKGDGAILFHGAGGNRDSPGVPFDEFIGALRRLVDSLRERW